MSDLSQLLELMHDAGSSWTTLHARYRVTRHTERANAAFLAHAERTGATTFALGSSSESETVPAVSEEVVAIWRSRPDRLRIEYQSGANAGAYGVRVGETWWRFFPRSGAMSNADDTTVGTGLGDELTLLTDPSLLLGALRFEPRGRAITAGRTAIVADGWPRFDGDRHRPGAFALHQLGLGAERYRVHVDTGSGLLLATEAIRYDEPFHSTEALELHLDEALQDGLFDFEPPPGEEVRSAAEHHVHERRRHCSITEAAHLAPFLVLVPARVPEGWVAHCSYFAQSREPRPRGAMVSIHYRSDSAHEDLNLTQCAADDPDPTGLSAQDWEQVESRGRRMRVRARSDDFPQSQLQLEYADTRVLMISNTLSREQIVALAASLVPVPPALPPG